MFRKIMMPYITYQYASWLRNKWLVTFSEKEQLLKWRPRLRYEIKEKREPFITETKQLGRIEMHEIEGGGA